MKLVTNLEALLKASERKFESAFEEIAGAVRRLEDEARAADGRLSQGMDNHHKGLEVLLETLRRLQDNVERILEQQRVAKVQDVTLTSAPAPKIGGVVMSPNASADAGFARDARLQSTMIEHTPASVAKDKSDDRGEGDVTPQSSDSGKSEAPNEQGVKIKRKKRRLRLFNFSPDPHTSESDF